MSEELELPEFLIISPEDRLSAWQGVKVTHPSSAPVDEEWREKERLRQHMELGKRRTKNAANLARLKASHPGQQYNRTLKRWITVEVTA